MPSLFRYHLPQTCFSQTRHVQSYILLYRFICLFCTGHYYPQELNWISVQVQHVLSSRLTCKHFNASLAHATWHLTQYPAFTAIVQWIVCPSGGFYLLFEIPYVFCCGVEGEAYPVYYNVRCAPSFPTPHLPPQHAPDFHEPTVDVYLHLANVTLSSTHACTLTRPLATLWRQFETREHTRVRTDNPTDICHDSL